MIQLFLFLFLFFKILTDMEDSQIATLPPDLAAEAQFLRRDWETRNGSRIGKSNDDIFTNCFEFKSDMGGFEL